VVLDTFFGPADANGRSASLCVVPLEMPLDAVLARRSTQIKERRKGSIMVFF
jgi:hypothetical protein